MTLDTVPFIREGVGETPADGGCVMQMADWIERREWTDKPPCVHPVIRSFAIAVNDRLDDTERQKLLDLIPRMMNTNTGDEALTRKLLGYLARQVYPIYSTWAERAGYDDHGTVLACIEAAERGDAADAAWAAETAEAARAAEAADAAEAAWAAWAAETAWAAEAVEAAWAAETARAAEAAPLLTLLIGLLDKYDELTARKSVKPVDLAPVCEVLNRA